MKWLLIIILNGQYNNHVEFSTKERCIVVGKLIKSESIKNSSIICVRK